MNSYNLDDHRDSFRAVAALRLSHICHHFRNLLLSSPRFWNQINIYPKISLEITEACIQWSREAPLDIYLTVFVDRPERSEYFEAFSKVLAHSHRWRKFTLYAVNYHPADMAWLSPTILALRNRVIRPIEIENSSSLAIASPDPEFLAPLLQEISILKDENLPQSGLKGLTPGFAWTIPRLKVLNVSHYFPYDLPALANVTTLEFAIGRGKFDYPRVLRALKSMHALEDLRVRFEGCGEDRAGEEVRFHPISLENVNRITLLLVSRKLSKAGRASSQLAFYTALFCPNASELRIQFYGAGVVDDGNTAFIADDHLKYAGELFPRLSKLHLDFCQRKYPVGVVVRQLFSPAIPFHSLRHLDTLVIQCKAPLYIRMDSDAPSFLTIPALRRLSLDVARGTLGGDSNLRRWVAHYINQLRLQGEWERFEELTIRSAELSGDFRPVEKRVPRDKVDAWCQTVRPSC